MTCAVPVADLTTATRRLAFGRLDPPSNAIALRVHAIAEPWFDRWRSWPVSRTQPLSGDILAIAQTRRSFDMRTFSRSLRVLVYSRPCAGAVILAVCIGVALIQSRATSISASVGALASRPCFGGGRGVFSDVISNDRARSAINESRVLTGFRLRS